MENNLVVGLIVLFTYPYVMWAIMYRMVVGNWRVWEDGMS